MGILLFYLVALIPIIFGAILWITNRHIVWKEWLGGAVISLVIASGFHAVSVLSLGMDKETWSGQVSSVTHYPYWKAQWQEAVYRTETYYTGVGENRTMHTRRVFSHYETRTRHYPERWEASTTLDQEIDISEKFHNDIKVLFGNQVDTQTPYKANFVSGDRNIYVVYNKSGAIVPVTDSRMWKNKIRYAKSVFSFVEVPESISKDLYEWPENKNVFESNRVIGLAKDSISTKNWDILNSEVGPIKGINLIIIGFDSHDAMLGQYQEAMWFGGKKNDLVICYGPTNDAPTWSYVFGWTEESLIKQNIQSLILEQGVTESIIPLVKSEVIKSYKIKDWSKFDYITIEPPFYIYILYLIFTIAATIGYYYWSHNNEFSK